MTTVVLYPTSLSDDDSTHVQDVPDYTCQRFLNPSSEGKNSRSESPHSQFTRLFEACRVARSQPFRHAGGPRSPTYLSQSALQAPNDHYVSRLLDLVTQELVLHRYAPTPPKCVTRKPWPESPELSPSSSSSEDDAANIPPNSATMANPSNSSRTEPHATVRDGLMEASETHSLVEKYKLARKTTRIKSEAAGAPRQGMKGHQEETFRVKKAPTGGRAGGDLHRVGAAYSLRTGCKTRPHRIVGASGNRVYHKQRRLRNGEVG